MENVMFDASTLVLLAKATLLGVSLELANGHVGPVALGEVRRGGGEDVAVVETAVSVRRLRHATHVGRAARLAADFALGAGEAEALMTAAVQGWVLATDDRKAMVAARALNVRFLTAIHFLEEAVRSGRVGREEAKAKLASLARLGRYSGKILDAAHARSEGGMT